jgi:hypothetical protein
MGPRPLGPGMRGRVVAVEGPSAAGKSRAVREVAPALGAAPLAEAYDRLTPRPPLRWDSPEALLRLERRLLAEEARRYREARELAVAGALVIADTGFLGPLTYTQALVAHGWAPARVLVRLVEDARTLASEGRWGLPDAWVYLRTSPAERQRRAALDPRGHPASLRRRHERVGASELRFYRERVAPAFGIRFRFVSGTGAPGEVAARVRRAVARGVAGRGGPRPRVGRLLDSLAPGPGVP